MKFEFNIKDTAGTVEVDIYGIIGYGGEEGDTSVASYNEFTRKISEIGADSARKVVVNIRSTGGDVNDALLIYEQLKALKAKVVTRCFGYTASAATIIAQSASAGERKMSANGLYLIHKAMTAAEGNAIDLAERKELLDKTDERIANIYAKASGRDAEGYLELMGENGGRGKWLTAEEALEFGLIDEIISAEPITNINKEAVVGLPEPPQIDNTMENEKSIFTRIANWFETRVDGEMATLTNDLVAEREKVDNLVAERYTLKVENEEKTAIIANLTVEVENLQKEVAELKAMAVKATEPQQLVQDPEPTPAPTQKSANELAYDKDVAVFK